MGRKRPQKGGRRGPRKSGASPQDQRRDEGAFNRPGGGAPGGGAPEPSRLLLTRLIREDMVWDVYIATTPQNGGSNLTQLEFQEKGARHLRPRYTRPLQGALLEALYAGTPVSRARIEEELELAIRAAESGDGGSFDDGSLDDGSLDDGSAWGEASGAGSGDGPEAGEAEGVEEVEEVDEADEVEEADASDGVATEQAQGG
jgi:hypothetical protein